MVAILDQYEVEYKETYTSGTYDQVVMGKMVVVERQFGIKTYVTGARGVVYGSNNAAYAGSPGTGVFDYTNSVSYRLQPYTEKAGNCRAAKLPCYQERIYDTLLPDPITCFKLNGANLFLIVSGTANQAEVPGIGPNWGPDMWTNAFVIFNNYIPSGNSSNLRNLNTGVDRHWTKAFPYEPKYSSVQRQKTLSFKDIEVSYEAKFKTSTMTLLPTARKMTNLIVGTVGPTGSLKTDATFGAPYVSWFHYWAVDSKIGSSRPIAGRASSILTGSLPADETIKVLFGYGDSSTAFFSNIVDTNNPSGYALRGTTNWPTFRSKKLTDTDFGSYPASSYETITGSYWNISPIIRGWKYGIYNGLPDYTSAYFRQGRYGQFRDMLEQRQFVATIDESSTAPTLILGPVDVKFVDADQNLIDPVSTQSQNLSQYATSSLPYFDLQSRSRPPLQPLTNLSLISFKVDEFANVTI